MFVFAAGTYCQQTFGLLTIKFKLNYIKQYLIKLAMLSTINIINNDVFTIQCCVDTQ